MEATPSPVIVPPVTSAMRVAPPVSDEEDPDATMTIATARLAKVIGLSYPTGTPSTEKPTIAMKCMVQMPEPMEVAPRASQPALKERSVRSDRVVQRRPRPRRGTP